jgi:hypothetical protein
MTKPNSLMINKLLSIITEREREFTKLLQVEELREAWTRWWRRSVIPTVVPRRGGEGRADVMVLRRGGEGRTVEADVKEERALAVVWRENDRAMI